MEYKALTAVLTARANREWNLDFYRYGHATAISQKNGCSLEDKRPRQTTALRYES